MNLASARTMVQRCLERMRTLYGSDVFDEWALVLLQDGAATLAAYEGPRLELFRSRFVADSHALRALLDGRSLPVGDFVFAPAAAGTAFDACVCVGPRGYLIFNHTERSMDDIRRDERWIQAQRPFYELTETFRTRPLE
jgi:hypothetical protein